MDRRLHFTTALFRNSLFALLLVFATTFLLLLIGRRQLGEGAIALVYLVPVIWSGYRWGQGPGMAAALAAALCFDYLFIPPFYTFSVGSLEGWLVLAIFLVVAVVLVGRFEASLAKAREMTYLYELSSALCNVRTQDAAARTTARYIQQLFQASLVRVFVHPSSAQSGEIMVSEPEAGAAKVKGRPDRQVPVLNDWGLIGEIQIWRGEYTQLPPDESPLLKEVSLEVGKALERTQPSEDRVPPGGLRSIPSAN